jgi:hypothetical protein
MAEAPPPSPSSDVVEEVNKWILDFEGYQVNSIYFPIEIALLNVHQNNLCYTWRIKYSDAMAVYNQNTEWQFRKHRLGWNHGNMYLYEALKEMRTVIDDYCSGEHVVYVKGLEKTNWMRQQRWFPFHYPKVTVQEIQGVPSFRDLSMFYGAEYACTYHTNAPFDVRCARRKAYQLLPYVATCVHK